MDKLIFLVLVNLFYYANGVLEIKDHLSLPNHALNQQLYRDVLDPELCQKQMDYLRRKDTILLARFLDAGIRTPRGMLLGNFVDMGNYPQCLGIQETLPDLVIEGKYCTISVPFNQELYLPTFPAFPEWPNFEWPDIPWSELNPNSTRIAKEIFERVTKSRQLKNIGQVDLHTLLNVGDMTLNLAICIPKACTTREVVEGMMFNLTSIGFKYEENFCRLANDKPWVAADYVFIALFSIICVITILSTAYDVRHTIVLKTNPKEINGILRSFSVYTNTRRLVTYRPVPGALECLDGIRVLAILWVIVGHTYSSRLTQSLANPMDALDWIVAFSSLWITATPITVDTFFLLSGLLVVYTAAGKFTRIQLLKNIHLFYLNRLLRMFPILAAFVLVQASILNWIADGPNWEAVVQNTNSCRVFWWSTLLHVQNIVNPSHLCLSHTWYLAIDVQLHILSPLVLVWLLGARRRTAWIVLAIAMLVSLVPATVYNVIMKFPGYPPFVPSRVEELHYYLRRYYIQTMTRCSPFFVGMIYGYLLHLYRGRTVVISKVIFVILWLCSIILSATVIISKYPILQLDWDNQKVDTIVNSFSRPAWALAVGWLIFACVHGYGGPINWVLSLRMWKFPSRLSYAMYITHYSMMTVINSTELAPVYFTTFSCLYRFFGDLILTLTVSFVLTVLVDSPCSTLIKLFLGGGPKRKQEPVFENEPKNEQTMDGILNRAYVNDETKSNIKE